MSDNNDQEKETVQEAGAKGGKARSERLTPEQRSELARQAVEARWEMVGMTGEPVIAPHVGTIRIGQLEIPCCVLDDGTRVLHERGIMKALGVTRAGTKRGVNDASDGGGKLPLFLAQKNLIPFMDKDLAEVARKPIWYLPPSGPNRGRPHKGIRAEMLPKICNVWRDARDAGVLGRAQMVVAANADLIFRGLAEVGIVGLVDEATGFQDVRARDALAKILEAFIAKELRKWVSTFPPDFYKEMFRLRNIPYAGQVKRPRLFGKLTNDLIYERLAPGVLQKLRERNPVLENGRRKNKHHQWLTADVGVPELREHLKSVTTLMRATEGPDWDTFYRMLDRALPKQVQYPLFDRSTDKEDDGETGPTVER